MRQVSELLRREHLVANSVYGADDGGIARIGFDSLPQLGNVLIQGAAVRDVVKAPALFKKGVSIHCLILSLEQ